MHKIKSKKLFAGILVSVLLSAWASPAMAASSGWSYYTNRSSVNPSIRNRITDLREAYGYGQSTADSCRQAQWSTNRSQSKPQCSSNGSQSHSQCTTDGSQNQCQESTIIIQSGQHICFSGDGHILDCGAQACVKPQPSTPAEPSTPTEPGQPEDAETGGGGTGSTENESTGQAKDTFAAYRQQILDLVNAERASVGLNPVKALENVATAADIRAVEIEQVFSHMRPDGTSCFTVLDGVGNFQTMGENIAIGHRSAEEVMEGWMNSEGHRKNILSSNFTGLGVGVYKTAAGTLCWVQLFVG